VARIDAGRTAVRGWAAALAGALAVTALAACSSQGVYTDASGDAPAPSGSAPSASASPTAAGLPADAQRYTSDRYGYSMMFPGGPQVMTAQQTVAGQDVTLEVAQYASSSDSVIATEGLGFASGTLSGTDPQVLLGGSLGGLVATVHGEVVSQAAAELDGAPALRADIKIEGADGDGQFILALHGDTEYVVFAAGDYAAAFDAYIESFEFTD